GEKPAEAAEDNAGGEALDADAGVVPDVKPGHRRVAGESAAVGRLRVALLHLLAGIFRDRKLRELRHEAGQKVRGDSEAKKENERQPQKLVAKQPSRHAVEHLVEP